MRERSHWQYYTVLSCFPPQVARTLWPVRAPGEEQGAEEAAWEAAQASGDVLIWPQHYAASLTSRGMRQAVAQLGALHAGGTMWVLRCVAGGGAGGD